LRIDVVSDHRALADINSLPCEQGEEQKQSARYVHDDRQLDAGQMQRLRRARRTAAWIGVIAFAVFVLSIAQMLWLQHHPQLHKQAIVEALSQ
jgi:hypothetical protein